MCVHVSRLRWRLSSTHHQHFEKARPPTVAHISVACACAGSFRSFAAATMSRKRAGGRIYNPRLEAGPAGDDDDDDAADKSFARADSGRLKQRVKFTARRRTPGAPRVKPAGMRSAAEQAASSAASSGASGGGIFAGIQLKAAPAPDVSLGKASLDAAGSNPFAAVVSSSSATNIGDLFGTCAV